MLQAPTRMADPADPPAEMPMASSAHWRADELPPEAREALRTIVGKLHFMDARADRYAYARDRLPWGLFRLRAGELPATLPSAIVAPADRDQLVAIVETAKRLGLRLIPFGAGSGVLGAALPLNCEVIVDLKRMNRILAIDEIDGTVRVQAGMNGGQFEAELKARGYSANHLPQSIHMSTVGGWAACRGAGQVSSRHGKIEDIVIGLEAVLPNGRLLDVRPAPRRAVGPSIKDLMIGSEGVFGFITELTLRITRLPEYSEGRVYAFPSLQAGLDAMRQIVQSEGRPAVMRLYDDTESAARTEGIAAFAQRPILGIFKFSGPRLLAMAEAAHARQICQALGAVEADDAPYRHWEATRYQSYSIKWQSAGYYMDTVEITGPWRALPQMYARMRQAVRSLHPDAYFGAHWSHIYAEGACQYMSLRLPPMDDAPALKLHRQAWDRLQRICLELGGSIAHHHGVGVFRNEWLRLELGAGMELLQILKDGIDPQNLLNPGKVGLRGAPGGFDVGTVLERSAS
jgi:alkyldihydroxyacetonephosphate synthase